MFYAPWLVSSQKNSQQHGFYSNPVTAKQNSVAFIPVVFFFKLQHFYKNACFSYEKYYNTIKRFNKGFNHNFLFFCIFVGK